MTPRGEPAAASAAALEWQDTEVTWHGLTAEGDHKLVEQPCQWVIKVCRAAVADGRAAGWLTRLDVWIGVCWVGFVLLCVLLDSIDEHRLAASTH